MSLVNFGGVRLKYSIRFFYLISIISLSIRALQYWRVRAYRSFNCDLKRKNRVTKQRKANAELGLLDNDTYMRCIFDYLISAGNN